MQETLFQFLGLLGCTVSMPEPDRRTAVALCQSARWASFTRGRAEHELQLSLLMPAEACNSRCRLPGVGPASSCSSAAEIGTRQQVALSGQPEGLGPSTTAAARRSLTVEVHREQPSFTEALGGPQVSDRGIRVLAPVQSSPRMDSMAWTSISCSPA